MEGKADRLDGFSLAAHNENVQPANVQCEGVTSGNLRRLQCMGGHAIGVHDSLVAHAIQPVKNAYSPVRIKLRNPFADGDPLEGCEIDAKVRA